VIKAVKVKESLDVERARAYAGVAAMVLFDAKAPDALADALPGGNGIAFDWSLLESADGARRFMLSGGLDGVQYRRSHPHHRPRPPSTSRPASSARPASRTPDLIRKFIEAARSAR
jgi:phosphoribosylanthranilate isomerase